jgi:hypothetical protein
MIHREQTTSRLKHLCNRCKQNEVKLLTSESLHNIMVIIALHYLAKDEVEEETRQNELISLSGRAIACNS